MDIKILDEWLNKINMLRFILILLDFFRVKGFNCVERMLGVKCSNKWVVFEVFNKDLFVGCKSVLIEYFKRVVKDDYDCDYFCVRDEFIFKIDYVCKLDFIYILLISGFM